MAYINLFKKFWFTAGYNIRGDDVDGLQSEEDIDPEVRPGLFQGDMAMNNEVSILLWSSVKYSTARLISDIVSPDISTYTFNV